MENKTFNYSEKIIKQRKKILFTMAIMIPIVLVIGIIIGASSDNRSINVGKLALIIVPCVLLISLEFVLVSYFVFKKLRSTKLIISEEGIERIGGKSKELIKYSEIKKFHVRNDKYGKLFFIKLNTGKKNITIFGFDDMESILKSLKENVTETLKISEKQYKVDWNSPVVIIITIAVTVGILLSLMKLNLSIYKIFNLLFPLAFGTYFLFFKPVSKAAGARFRIFEIILSCIMLIGGIIGLISALLK